MPSDSFQVRAKPKTAVPAFLLDQLECGFGGKSGIGRDYHLRGPGRWDKLREHLAKEYILMTFDCRIDHCGGDRDAPAPLLEDEQDH